MDRRVALVTCREFADLDEDDRLLLPELAALGIAAEPAVWDDATVDWDGYDLAVVRSTWDYVDRRDEFLNWAASVPRLANSAPTIAWSTDKRYVRELEAGGVPVVPTTWLEPGDEVELAANGVVIIKPSVGAGSRDAGRFDLAGAQRELAEKHVRRLLDRGEKVMIQPYLDAVESAGETAMLFVGGRYSHAIRKEALLHGPDVAVRALFRPEVISPRVPSGPEREVAERVLDAVRAHVPDELLYARVDVLPDAAGRPVLLEVELAEPSLFLRHDPAAAARFAAEIGTRLDRVLKTR
jgi:hypothetical protein